MIVSYKTEINPTEEQKILINKTIGTCRFIYNFLYFTTKNNMKKRRNLKQAMIFLNG